MEVEITRDERSFVGDFICRLLESTSLFIEDYFSIFALLLTYASVTFIPTITTQCSKILGSGAILRIYNITVRDEICPAYI